MAKFTGWVGYVTQTETSPGIWQSIPVEHKMRGDVLRLASSATNDGRIRDGSINDDIDIQQRISLVADPFAYENFSSLKYVIYMGVKWKITGVEVPRPRLILTLGGVWNG